MRIHCFPNSQRAMITKKFIITIYIQHLLWNLISTMGTDHEINHIPENYVIFIIKLYFDFTPEYPHLFVGMNNFGQISSGNGQVMMTYLIWPGDLLIMQKTIFIPIVAWALIVAPALGWIFLAISWTYRWK